MTNPFLKIYTEEFWLQMRKDMKIPEYDAGLKRCALWSYMAMKQLERIMPGHPFKLKMYSGDDAIYAITQEKLSNHYFLSANYRGIEYIADGTAGQISIQHPQGFYGKINSTKKPLKQIYELSEITKINHTLKIKLNWKSQEEWRRETTSLFNSSILF